MGNIGGRVGLMETRGRVVLEGQAGCRRPGSSDNTPKFSRSQARGVSPYTHSQPGSQPSVSQRLAVCTL